MIYFDNAATTPIDPSVLSRLQEVESSYYANPSSIHSAGQQSKFVIEEVRDIIAESLGCFPKEIIFTSGGTESNNLAIIGTALANREKGNHIITTRVEHPSVLNTFKYLATIGFEISYIEVDQNGWIDPQRLSKIINNETILVSVMMVNNEVGNIFPVQEIGEVLQSKTIIFHVDAIQAFGKIDFTVDEINVDLISLSGHKIYGPKGIGALYIRTGTKVQNILFGGSQERVMRAGTENLAGIAGFGEAVAQMTLHKSERNIVKKMRDTFEEKLLALIPEAEVHCINGQRIFNISNVYFPKISVDSLLLNLDLEGIACSSGSACSSGTVSNSHVLSAMQLPKQHAAQSLRFSFGRFNTLDEIEKSLKIISEIYFRIKHK
jgi:cysteine desulfurase